MIVWHYTTGQKARLIHDSGCLIPAFAGVEPPEQPIIWFSLAPYFEKSALKGVLDEDGNYRTATLEEMMDLGSGLYRLGRPMAGLLCGERLRKAAKMQSITWRRLVKSANHMKANPSDWFGYVGESMPIHEMKIEKMSSDLRWVPATVADLGLAA